MSLALLAEAAPTQSGPVVVTITAPKMQSLPSTRGHGIVIASDHFHSIILAPSEAIGCDTAGFGCRTRVSVRVANDEINYPSVALRCGEANVSDDVAIIAVPVGNLQIVPIASEIGAGATLISPASPGVTATVSEVYEDGASFGISPRNSGLHGVVMGSSMAGPALVGVIPIGSTRAAGPTFVKVMAAQLRLAVAISGTASSVVAQEFATGRALLQGIDLTADPARGIEFLRQAAEEGSAPAADALGEYLGLGTGIIGSLDEGESWLRKAAANGFPGAGAKAQSMSRVSFQRGASAPPGVTVPSYSCANALSSRYFSLSDENLQMRVDQNDPRAMLASIEKHQLHGAKKIALLQRAAALGLGEAMLELSFVYSRGEEDAHVSAALGAAWMTNAMNAGSPSATELLTGFGGAPLSQLRKLELLEHAAYVGSDAFDIPDNGADAYLLATEYEKMSRENGDKARFWYRVSALEGNSDAYSKWRMLGPTARS